MDRGMQSAPLQYSVSSESVFCPGRWTYPASPGNTSPTSSPDLPLGACPPHPAPLSSPLTLREAGACADPPAPNASPGSPLSCHSDLTPDSTFRALLLPAPTHSRVAAPSIRHTALCSSQQLPSEAPCGVLWSLGIVRQRAGTLPL